MEDLDNRRLKNMNGNIHNQQIIRGLDFYLQAIKFINNKFTGIQIQTQNLSIITTLLPLPHGRQD